MADASEIQALSQRMELLPQLAVRCESVAEALRDAGEPLIAEGFFGWFVRDNEYTRLRRMVIEAIREAQALTSIMRTTTESAALIQTARILRGLDRCCTDCPAHNVAREAEGQRFQCRLYPQLQAPTLRPFKFVLGEEGQIHET